MKIGIIGLQNSGKTTIFNAVTKSEAEVTSYSSNRIEPNLAIVDVEDERVTRLSEMYQPKKTTYATVEFIDFAGLASGSAKNGLFSGEAMGLIKTVDAIAVVVRNFSEETIDAVLGPPDPERDLAVLEEELIFSDLMIVEKRLERIQADKDRGKKTADLVTEEKLLGKIHPHLEELTPLREMELTEDERKLIHGFQFLSLKPSLVVINSDDGNYGSNGDLVERIGKSFPVIEFAGKFEMELSVLDEDEAQAFMADLGIEESARVRLIQSAYKLLGYISFFTVGEDEVRAWTITEGTNAVNAAGEIHSDLQRGFIRAECFSWEDLLSLGTEKALKAKGLLRLEGKEYIVKDGDILNIRFST
ncbi:MAG: redox-regulated ATPase YchF [Spirochaetaceae bacterium]